jgi:hypothetical protein
LKSMGVLWLGKMNRAQTGLHKQQHTARGSAFEWRASQMP